MELSNKLARLRLNTYKDDRGTKKTGCRSVIRFGDRVIFRVSSNKGFKANLATKQYRLISQLCWARF